MLDVCTYHIDVHGPVALDDLNAMSPLPLTVVHEDDVVTQLAVHTDQSGVIGLLRHLHGLGFVILSMARSY